MSSTSPKCSLLEHSVHITYEYANIYKNTITSILDTEVGIATGYGLDDRVVGVRVR
jgi:hypothetical protein